MAELVRGRALARVMAFVALAGAAVTPLMLAVLWLALDDAALFATVGASGIGVPASPDVTPSLSGAARVAGWLITTALSLPMMIALWCVAHTFREAAQGRPFSPRAVASFRRFALASLVAAVGRVVQTPILSAAVTALSPTIQGQLMVTVGSHEIGALFGAFLLLTLAHVFAEGRRMADDVEGLL